MIINETKLKNEMIFFVPLCTHENPKECLAVGFDSLPSGASELIKNVVHIQHLETKTNFESERFDVIVVNEETNQTQEIFRILKKDGILCSAAGADIKNSLSRLSDFYRIIMPFHNLSLIFASNKYHPTADIILDRADFCEKSEYYNEQAHLASFALYKNIKQGLRGLAKN